MTMRSQANCALHVRCVLVIGVVIASACHVTSFRISTIDDVSRDFFENEALAEQPSHTTQSNDAHYERTFILTTLVNSALRLHKRSLRNPIVATRHIRHKRIELLGLGNLDFTATTFDESRRQHSRPTSGYRGLPSHRMPGMLLGSRRPPPPGRTGLSTTASMDDLRKMIRNLMNAGR